MFVLTPSGDVTVKTWLGRLVVIGMIMVGVVLIPVSHINASGKQLKFSQHP